MDEKTQNCLFLYSLVLLSTWKYVIVRHLNPFYGLQLGPEFSQNEDTESVCSCLSKE